MPDRPARILPGQRWREKRTGRIIVILQSDVNGREATWRYLDEPDGWAYCDAPDFLLWGGFEYLRG